MQAPGLTDTGLAVRAAHHLLLAHGLALRAFRERRPSARLGHHEPDRERHARRRIPPTDEAAARAWDAQSNRLFLDPVYLGALLRRRRDRDAGRSDRTNEATPDGLVQPGDLDLISAPADFAGVNHYTNMVARADYQAPDGIALVARCSPRRPPSGGPTPRRR